MQAGADRQTVRPTNGWMDGQTEKQTGREEDRKTDIQDRQRNSYATKFRGYALLRGFVGLGVCKCQRRC